MSVSSIDKRLQDLGIELPLPATPVASYAPFIVVGDFVYVSGQLPLSRGKMTARGRVGEEVGIEEGVRAAALCAVNLMAQLKVACGGNLARVRSIVRLGGFIASGKEFFDQPVVMNGASDLFLSVFGEVGKHSRTAVGVSVLPLNAPVEVDAIVRLDRNGER